MFSTISIKIQVSKSAKWITRKTANLRGYGRLPVYSGGRCFWDKKNEKTCSSGFLPDWKICRRFDGGGKMMAGYYSGRGFTLLFPVRFTQLSASNESSFFRFRKAFCRLMLQPVVPGGTGIIRFEHAVEMG